MKLIIEEEKLVELICAYSYALKYRSEKEGSNNVMEFEKEARLCIERAKQMDFFDYQNQNQ